METGSDQRERERGRERERERGREREGNCRVCCLSVQQAAEDEADNNKRLQEQQDTLVSRYDRDVASCMEEKQKNHDSCQQAEDDHNCECVGGGECVCVRV